MAVVPRWYICEIVTSVMPDGQSVQLPAVMDGPNDPLMQGGARGIKNYYRLSKSRVLSHVWAEEADHPTLAARAGVIDLLGYGPAATLLSSLSLGDQAEILTAMQAWDSSVLSLPALTVGGLIDWFGNSLFGGSFNYTDVKFRR